MTEDWFYVWKKTEPLNAGAEGKVGTFLGGVGMSVGQNALFLLTKYIY